MKKYLFLFIATIIATVAQAANGDRFSYEDFYYRIISEDDHTVKLENCFASGDVVIPAFVTIDNSRYTVVAISDNAFSGKRSLTSVTIPNSVTEIGKQAFYFCSNLTSVTIPNSVTEIGERAFCYCSNLTGIIIEDGNKSYSSDNGVLYNSDKTILIQAPGAIKEMDIPNSVTQIGSWALSYCNNLTSVTIPNSVTQIGYGAFYCCTKLTSVIIPNSVTEIGQEVFLSCISLTGIIIEDGNKNYSSENGVLYNSDKTILIQAPGAIKEMDIPNSVTQIGYGAFYYCTNLTSVTIPGSVTQIGSWAFSYCNNLTSVTIPNSVTQIGNGAFYCCSNLTSVIIPNSVTEIGEGVFTYCSDLSSVIIPNSVTQIGFGAFSYCSSLTSVTIPNSVTEIGKRAFYDCSSLTSVTIPNSLTEIKSEAFFGCCNLTSVTIPKSVTEIRGHAFSGCRSLKKIINLNPKPQALGNYEFKNVPADAVIYIPKGSLKAYRKAYEWTQFTDFREMGEFDLSLGVTELDLKKGKTAEITVTIEKDSEVSIESEEWSTSNPEIATIENGKVTAVGEGIAVIYFTVTDSYGAPHTESCKVTVTDDTGVSEVTIDASAPVDVYTMQGIAVLINASTADLGNLPTGLYIIRQGKAAKKVLVK